MLNRRSFLRSAPAAGVALTVPAVAIAGAKYMTPNERLAHHWSEFKKAASDIDPRIRFSMESIDFQSPHAPIYFVGMWATGFYDGDGDYLGGGKYHQNDRYAVTLLADPMKGERGFSVIPHHEPDRRKWMKLTETELEAFIGVKAA